MLYEIFTQSSKCLKPHSQARRFVSTHRNNSIDHKYSSRSHLYEYLEEGSGNRGAESSGYAERGDERRARWQSPRGEHPPSPFWYGGTLASPRLRRDDYAVAENGVSVRTCRGNKLAVAISFGIDPPRAAGATILIAPVENL